MRSLAIILVKTLNQMRGGDAARPILAAAAGTAVTEGTHGFLTTNPIR
jgi:hypothetical protein